MSDDTWLSRQPGDPIPEEVIRQLRKRAGLSQEELAFRLGLKGGKAVISGWETGRTQCEGPAAELLLRLVGAVSPSVAVMQLHEEAEGIWRRAKNFLDSWRQVTLVPEVPIEIERNLFVKLFPGIEIPPAQHAHGFPFIDHGLPRDVYGVSAEGWIGAIPSEPERLPRYLWLLKRGGEFLYREPRWEDDKNAITQGHVHVGGMLQLALASIVFLGRLAQRCGLEGSVRYVLRLDLENMRGRGIVAGSLQDASIPDSPTNLSSAPRLHGSIVRSLSEIVSAPLKVGYAWVGELLMPLRPDMADDAALEWQLRQRYAEDKQARKYRFLGFLDELLK